LLTCSVPGVFCHTSRCCALLVIHTGHVWVQHKSP
jgi:hypothetical protein